MRIAYISLSFSLLVFGINLNAKKKITIRGKGPLTLNICDTLPHFSCWYSRPYGYCEIPEGQKYKITTKNKIKKIELFGGLSDSVFHITNTCYLGSEGVSCKKYRGKMRCKLEID